LKYHLFELEILPNVTYVLQRGSAGKDSTLILILKTTDLLLQFAIARVKNSTDFSKKSKKNLCKSVNLWQN